MKKFFKPLFATVLSLACLCSCVACGNKSECKRTDETPREAVTLPAIK